jgi:hypothetical protein
MAQALKARDIMHSRDKSSRKDEREDWSTKIRLQRYILDFIHIGPQSDEPQFTAVSGSVWSRSRC